MFMITTAYDNCLCSCGELYSSEGNGLTQCIDCYTNSLLTNCLTCHSQYLFCNLIDGNCNECISLEECIECHCIEEELINGICNDCLISAVDGPVCSGCLCLDENLVDTLCEDCLDIIQVGEK